MLPDLEKYIPDQTPVLARDMNTLGQVVRMLNNVSGSDVFVDSAGIHFKRPPAPRGIEFVSLTVNGGSNGTQTASPTYTYDIAPVTFEADGTPTVGDVLDEAKEPVVARPHGAVDAAEYGIAIRATDAGYVLLYAFEVPQTTDNCS